MEQVSQTTFSTQVNRIPQREKSICNKFHEKILARNQFHEQKSAHNKFQKQNQFCEKKVNVQISRREETK